MAEIQCVPSSVTISPCPSGMAPIVVVESDEQPVMYEHHYDHIPVQDLIVFLAMLLSLFIGFNAGKT